MFIMGVLGEKKCSSSLNKRMIRDVNGIHVAGPRIDHKNQSNLVILVTSTAQVRNMD